MRHTFIAVLFAAAAIVPVVAQSRSAPDIDLTRAVFIERAEPVPGGGTVRTIEPADDLRSGDRVVLMMEWQAASRTASGKGFTLSSAIPGDLYYRRGGGDTQVSIDGGRNWGQLGGLRHGSRLAMAQDVTHLRWRIAPGRDAGRVSFSAVVR